jgi:hypothetical protein
MSLEEFVKRALSDIAAGLNKTIAEGAVAVAYVDRVVFEVQVASSFDGSAVICTRGEIAVGRLTFTVATDLGVAPFPESER